MASGAAVESLERLAQDVFALVKYFALTGPRGRRQPGHLKEGEFLTLVLLQERGTMTVGQLQRELGVLPAQMSRFVKGLEQRDPPYILGRVNLDDKRKIDCSLTPAGVKVLNDYRQARVSRILEVLRELDEEDVEHLAVIVEHIRAVLQRKPER